jgi:urease accessory protein
VDNPDILGSNPQAFWSILVLGDSALPVGSFAHSNGLEAAAQLQLFSEGTVSSKASAVESFVKMATQSTLEMYAPTVIATNRVDSIREWRDANDQLHLRLVGNPPACRSSLDQGRSVLRLTSAWRDESNELVERDLLGEIQRSMDDGGHFSPEAPANCHLASIFGVVTALHGLNAAQACQLLGYCVARDLVSAAVRMNLLGPMAGVGVLGRAHRAASIGIDEGSSKMPTQASSCAPMLDLIQPCHDLLATRLFRT